MVLTNATTLGDPQVRKDLLEADKVFCKLDASNDRMLQLIDRPVAGVTVRSIVDGIKALRAEYPGYLAVQSMFMPQNTKDVEAFAELLNEIKPDEVQLNTPLRPVPKGWYIEARGNHERESAPYESFELKHLNREEARELEARLKELTGLKIVSVYKEE
jgi:wyosine [tRNA(Phe)-imidazoG37] synthetase (radical SAM superfamily)